MSLTGLNIRARLRRHLASLLDGIATVVDVPHPEVVPAASPAPTPPAPAAEPKAVEPKAAEPALPPLPSLPKVREPLHAQTTPPKPAPQSTANASTARQTEAAVKAKASPEERQAQHWARTRAGLLRFIDDNGGKASLRELHDYSERTYFVAHVGFSRMMEELTDEDLIDYDHDTAVASLTEAGRAELV